MAGSLQRPPLKILIPLHKCNKKSTKYKLIKNQKLHLSNAKTKLEQKGGHIKKYFTSNHQTNPRRPLIKQLLKHFKYCQSLSYNKLLLLLSSSLSSQTASNDKCCWTAKEFKKYWKILATASKVTAINYVQQKEQQQHQQQLQLQLLQILNKVFKSTKFRKNLLNRKKSQTNEIQFYRENHLLYKKIF